MALKTKLFREHWDADKRLAELELTRKGLLTCVAVARHERANATVFHPANAAGTFAYQHGTWALRDQFVGKDWLEDREDGVESIRNDKLKVRIAFSNVDLACDDNHVPKPRSPKGAGAERASAGLFDDLPHYAEEPSGDWAFYYLMLDERGAAELTRPVVKGGTFSAAIERIYLTEGGDDESTLLLDDGDSAEGFDPKIERK